MQAGKLTQDQVAQIMLMYIVYVWHDTGRKLATAAGPNKILQAQPSFGLFLAHDGPIEGWKHERPRPAPFRSDRTSTSFRRPTTVRSR